MTGPYRTPGALAEDGAQPCSPSGLGTRRSVHRRGIAAAGLLREPMVELHDGGLVLMMSDAGARSEIPFDEIDLVYFDFDGLIPGPPRVVLVTFGGTRHVIPRDLQELTAVVEALDRAVTRPITTQAKAALTRGDRLTFGPLIVELDGLVLHGQSLTWAEVSGVVAERDALVVYANEPRGRFGWVRLADVPHPRALLDVLRMRTRVVMSGLQLPGNP